MSIISFVESYIARVKASDVCKRNVFSLLIEVSDFTCFYN